MCLILVAWQVHPAYPLVVAANRDEFRARPTAVAARWPDAPHVVAGRDLEAGGTWLGVTDADASDETLLAALDETLAGQADTAATASASAAKSAESSEGAICSISG